MAKFVVEDSPFGSDPEGEDVYTRGSKYDRRGDPTVRLLCSGRDGDGHKERVIATFRTAPFDPAKGQHADFRWDSNLAVGGEKLHPTLRMREELDRRLMTEEEMTANGLEGPPMWIPVHAKHRLGDMGPMSERGLVILECPTCKLRHDIAEPKLQEWLEKMIIVGQRSLTLATLISIRTTR